MSNPIPESLGQRFDANPVLEATTPYDKGGVADPFALVLDGSVWLLYEAISADGDATIAAAYSDDGRRFKRYDANPVFDEYGHHSYPATVRIGDRIYMTPEHLSQSVSVWCTSVDHFPGGWEHVRNLDFDEQITDPTLFVHEDDLYLMVGLRLRSDDRRYFNKLLTIDDIETGVPTEICDIYPDDPASTVVSERSAFPVSLSNGVLLFHQADEELGPDGMYGGGDRGDQIHALELDSLSEEGVTVRRSVDNPVLTPVGDGWESKQVHSLSVVCLNGEWIGYYDGHDGSQWRGIGVLELSEKPTSISDPVGCQRHGMAGYHWSADRTAPTGRLYDDFADGSIHCRDGSITPRADLDRNYDLFRPVWSVGEGIPDTSGEAISFDPGVRHELHRYTDWTAGRWTVSFQFDPAPSTGVLQFYPLGPARLAHPQTERVPIVDGRRLTASLGRLPFVDLGISFWRVSLDISASRCRLECRRDGRTVIKTAAAVDLDSGSHQLAISRSPEGEWSLQVDDSLIGSVTDCYFPAARSTRLVVDGSDETVTLTQVRIN